MADLKITALPALVEAGVQSVDVLALADLSATETKKITVKDLVAAGVALIDDADIPGAKVGTLGTDQVATGAIQDGAVSNVKLQHSSISLGGVSISLGQNDGTPAFLLTDATGYLTTNLSGTITNAQLAGSIEGTKLLDTTITYAKLNLSDGDIPGAKIATGGITATQLAANSVTASELADDAVDTAAIADGAVVAASIATDTITANQIAANAIGASELADNSVDAGAIAADAVTTVKILDANVTAEKLAANLPGSILATGAIGSTQLAANSVTASELADNAVDSGAIAASAVTDAKISAVSGTKITDGTITATKLATANIDRSLNVASGNLGINNTVTAATRSGITYNAQGLITATVALAASDLPLATTSAVGGVSVGTGLAVTGAGALSLSNSVTAATISGITYNAQGQITATTALVAGDLPAATTSAKGAVLVTSGGGISVDGSGAISTSTSGITAGTYTKVTINSKGVATAGASLVSGDIPDLSATKLTSGTLNIGRFATNSILGSKFADSSVCQFTGAQSTSGVVTFPTAEFKGQFFYDLTNDDLYVYDGSAFQPVTITSGEIIYAGNYRADTNKITSLTAAGTAQGFTVNAALQAASAANNRYYFVCDKSGTGTSPAPTVTINPPDMILSNGASWEKLDISNFIAGQVASNIGVTATGGIQNTNVQSVLEELDTEKLNLTGGTLTGNLALNQSSSIIFEGSTPDDFETTLTVIDPTADCTVSLPKVTGTLVSSGDTGTVTSTMILDGTILNADINASAAIALTKLANVTAAHIIVGNASNVPTAVAITGDISISNAGLVAITADSIVNADIKSDAAIAGSKIVAGTTSVVGVVQLEDSVSSASTTKAATPASVKTVNDALTTTTATADAAVAKAGSTMTGNLILGNAKQVRFSELTANGANFVSLQAPDALAADVSYILPSAAPTANGQILVCTTAGVLSWTDDPTGQWVTNGTNVYYDGGNVGIGTGNSPSALFDCQIAATDKLEYGNNPRLFLQCATGNNGLRIWSDTTPIEARTDNSSRFFMVAGGPNHDTTWGGKTCAADSTFDSSPKLFLNATYWNGSASVTAFQTSIQAVATSAASNGGYLGLGASAAPDDLVILPTGNVGIGTIDPAVKFEVNGGADAIARITGTTTAARLDFKTNSYHTFVQLIHSHGGLRIYDQTNTEERFRLDSSGRFQIPSSTATGYNDFDGVGRLNLNNNSADGTVDFTQGIVFTSNASNEGTWTHAGIVATGSSGYSGNLIFGTDGANSRDQASISEKMRISAIGNVSIGGIAPVPTDAAYNKALLHIHQTQSGTYGSEIHLTNAATGSAAGNGMFISMWNDDDVYFTNQESDGQIRFTTGGNADVLVLNSTGQVRVLGDGSNDPLYVRGGSESNASIRLEGAANGADNSRIEAKHNLALACNGDGNQSGRAIRFYNHTTILAALDVDGNIEITGDVNGKYSLSNRRINMNGDFKVAQRGTSQTGVTGNGKFVWDRWSYSNHGPTVTLSQDTTTIPVGQGFRTVAKVETTTAAGSAHAGNVMSLQYKWEGQDVVRLKYGSANAESLAISFWARSSQTGVFVTTLRHDNKIISKQHTISTANTYNKYTWVIPGDTADALGTTNANSGMYIAVYISSGTNTNSGGLQTNWGAFHNAHMAAGNTLDLVTNTGTFYITGMQVEVGEVVTPYEHISYGEELTKCKRYYEVIEPTDGWAMWSWDTASAGTIVFFDEKRANPTVSYTGTLSNGVSPGSDKIGVYGVGGWRSFTSMSFSDTRKDSTRLMTGGLNLATAGQSCGIYWKPDTAITLDADL